MESILGPSARAFARHGYADTDLQAVADDLGIGKGTLYRYFPTKKELFLAVVDREVRRLRDAVDRAMASERDLFRQMISGTREYLSYLRRHPDLLDLIVQEWALFGRGRKTTYFLYHDERAREWRSILAGVMSKQRLRRMPVARITNVMGDLLFGTMMANHISGRKVSPDAQTRDLLDVAFFGILDDAERPAVRRLLAEGAP
jgi:AcrR family transcriptional regulator